MIARSVALFVLAAVAEIGGAYLVWIGLREGRGAWIAVLGGVALAAYGVIASFQPEDEFGRVLAAYGGVFIAGSLAWGMAFDGFRPDRFDLIGAAIALTGGGAAPPDQIARFPGFLPRIATRADRNPRSGGRGPTRGAGEPE